MLIPTTAGAKTLAGHSAIFVHVSNLPPASVCETPAGIYYHRHLPLRTLWPESGKLFTNPPSEHLLYQTSGGA